MFEGTESLRGAVGAAFTLDDHGRFEVLLEGSFGRFARVHDDNALTRSREFGPQSQTVPNPLPGAVEIFGTVYPAYRLVAALISLAVIIGVGLLIYRSTFGIRIRATMQNPEAARSLGTNTTRVSASAFALGAGLAGLALAAWMARLGIEPGSVRRAVEADLGAYYRVLQSEVSGAGSRELLAQMTQAGDTVAQLYPGLLALAAIGGLRLAWTWYHRVAERPLGPAPRPFVAFGFSDQMVWGWVAALALYLVSDDGAFVTGQSISPNGGVHIA